MKYHSQNRQLTLEVFRSSLSELSKSHRWIVMGALIIKHKTSLSDEETIGAIQEIPI